MTPQNTNKEKTASRGSRSLTPSLLTHLTAAGAAALAASSASAQVTVVNVNEDVGFNSGNPSFISSLPGAAQFLIKTFVTASSHAIVLNPVGTGYLAVKTQTMNMDSFGVVTKSPSGQKWSSVAGSVNSNGGNFALVSPTSQKVGYSAGTKGYFAFKFQDATNTNQLDYGWINATLTDDTYNGQNLHIASYAYDTSGQELPMGAAPEPSPALALAALSALTLGAVGVRKMKALRG